MAKTSFEKIEQLIEAAPNPTDPPADEEAKQEQGDNPDTPIQCQS